MGKPGREEQIRKLEELEKKYPNVPAEVYDIEVSEEMAIQYQEQFGI